MNNCLVDFPTELVLKQDFTNQSPFLFKQSSSIDENTAKELEAKKSYKIVIHFETESESSTDNQTLSLSAASQKPTN